jgi:hypothetical protein
VAECDEKAAIPFKKQKYAAFFSTVKAERSNKVQYMHIAVHVKGV